MPKINVDLGQDLQLNGDMFSNLILEKIQGRDGQKIKIRITVRKVKMCIFYV